MTNRNSTAWATAFTCAVALVCSSNVATAQQANPEFTLQPAADWQLLRYGDRCTLYRAFGEGENATELRIAQGDSEPRFTLSLSGRPVRSPYGSVVGVQFGPNEQTSHRGFVINKTISGQPAIVLYGVLLAPASADQAESGKAGIIGPEREAAIDSLVISRAVIDPFALALGSMGEPLSRLSRCATELEKKLYSAGRVSGGKWRASEPRNSPGDWLRSSDYPRDLIQKGMEGVVDFRLTVDANGVATNCHIESSNRPQMFDDIVCLALLQRARFNPALDSEGERVASYYTNRVRLLIP